MFIFNSQVRIFVTIHADLQMTHFSFMMPLAAILAEYITTRADKPVEIQIIQAEINIRTIS